MSSEMKKSSVETALRIVVLFFNFATINQICSPRAQSKQPHFTNTDAGQSFQCFPVPVHLLLMPRNKGCFFGILVRFVIDQNPFAVLFECAIHDSLYDDPFDTYFYIDLTNLKRFVETLKQMLAGKNETVMKGLEAVAPLLNVSSESLVQSLTHTVPDFSELRGQLDVIRNDIQTQLFSICFCEDPFNETLWLKYADNHRGFVQIYDLSCETTILCGKEEICRNCPSGQHPPQFYPVFYSDERYDASKFAFDCRMIRDTHWSTLRSIKTSAIF